MQVLGDLLDPAQQLWQPGLGHRDIIDELDAQHLEASVGQSTCLQQHPRLLGVRGLGDLDGPFGCADPRDPRHVGGCLVTTVRLGDQQSSHILIEPHVPVALDGSGRGLVDELQQRRA